MPDTTAITVIPIETPTLGDRSYRLTHVVESHIHNDYVTGGLALARRTGVADAA